MKSSNSITSNSIIGLRLIISGVLLAAIATFTPVASDKAISFYGICGGLITSGCTLLGTDKNA